MRPMPFHFRAIDSDGNTVRQSTTLFPTVKTAQEAADAMSRKTGDKHVVCESLDALDPRNAKNANGEKLGFAVYKEETEGERGN